MNEVSFSSDEKHIGAGSIDNLLIWNLKTGLIHKNLTEIGEFLSIYGTMYSPDGRYFVSVGTLHPHKGIKVWDTKDYALIKTLIYDTVRPYHINEDGTRSMRVASSLYFTPDSKYLITVDLDGMIIVWKTGTWELQSSIETNDIIWGITGTSDEQLIATGTKKGFVNFWSFENGKLQFRKALEASKAEITSISISPDGKYFSTNPSDSLKIISVDSGKAIHLLTIKNWFLDDIVSVCFSPSGKHFLSGGVSNAADFWSTESFKKISNFKGRINNPNQNEVGHNFVKTYFSPKGRYLALSNDAGFIYLYHQRYNKK